MVIYGGAKSRAGTLWFQVGVFSASSNPNVFQGRKVGTMWGRCFKDMWLLKADVAMGLVVANV